MFSNFIYAIRDTKTKEVGVINTTIRELAELGQSIWLDNINRSMIEGGQLSKMIGQGLLGMTSNPTIFEKAISNSADYDEKIEELCRKGGSTFDIYDDLTIKDIQDAADMFLPVYQSTNSLDGYVSLEINPKLAYKTQETIEEGKRLYEKVNRPNVMFKVPATNEGFGAIEELLSCGINVNATLIFSLQQYIDTVQAYIDGIKRFVKSGGDASKVRSVASVFISRTDTAVDNMLESLIKKVSGPEEEKLKSLMGKAAVANTRLIYERFLDIFSSPEFKKLASKGANIQRALWGSTSTKNPAYSDIKYVTELIGKDTVNTVPMNTFEAFMDHGRPKEVLSDDVSRAEDIILALREVGIDINEVCTKLLREGVIAFENSFISLLQTIGLKQEKICPRA